MARTNRQLKLIELISKHEIETQEALAEALRAEGYNVTQATVSRDIKELGLIKVMTANKGYKYAQPEQRESKASGKLLNLFRESVLSIDYSGNIIVVKTISGSANSAAMLIDKMNFVDVIGCVAGDDAILIVVKGYDKVQDIVDRLSSLMN
jgi:arginine repressor